MGSLESKPEKKRVQAKKEAQKQPRREMAGQGNTPYEIVTEGPNGQVGPGSVDAAIAQRKGLFLKRQNGDVFYRRPTTVMMFRNLPSTISRPSPHVRMMAMAQGKPDPLRRKEADSNSMSIEPANSPMEAEADQVADHIIAQKQKLASSETEKPSAEMQRKPQIQRKGADGPATVPKNVQSGIESKKGGGQPLPEDTREQMEDGMGADLSNVRIHDDGTSHDMNRSVNAQAFTHGNDVFFGEGKYKPGTDQGDHLLAHELTHTVQQGESPVKKQEDEKINRAEKGKTNSPKTTESPGENAKPENPAAKLPVTDISKGFKPSKEVEEYLAAQTKGKDIEIPVKIGKLAAGMIKVRQTKKPKGEVFGEYSIAKNQSIAYDGINMFNGLKSLDIFPVIAIKKGAVTRDQPLEMFYGFKIGDVVSGNAEKFIDQMKKNTEALGLIGFEVPTTTASIQNTVAGQNLVLKVSGLKAKVAGYLDAEAEFGLEGDAFTFKAGVNVDVKGLAEGSFSIERDKLGRLAGEGEIEADIANLNGKVSVKYLSTGDVQIRGSLAIESEKFSGNVSLMVADAVTADKMMRAELGLAEVEEEGKKKPDKKAPEKKTKKNQAVAIWGTVEARITPWLTGTATVGIDSKGQVTVIGKIAPPDDIVLMEQDTKKIDLFNVEAKGGYGVPFIGQVGLFASLGMFIKAGFGPLTLRNIAFEGKYSTDPSVLQNFKITGALNISAFALLGLEAEAGVFLTLLGHDIKAGVNVTAAAGIQAYAEVQPTFEYQEQNSPEGGKVGEAWLRGHFEAAAQLFLKLSGEFFVELDAPWWSPVGDERWPYPLFDIEYPLGPSMGIGGDIDWLVGSPDLPELKFSPVEFDPDKFTSDIMAEPPPKAGGGKGGEQESGGEWTSGGKGDKDGKPETKEGEGLKGKKKPKEDVSKMTDDQRFLRACELIGDVGDRAKSKPLAIVQLREKVKKIKKKYKIRSVTTKDKGETAEVTVSHKDKDNKKEPIKVKLMSAAEMMKLAAVGKSDLEAKVKGKEDPKEHNMSESDAQAIASEIAKKHYVFEDVTVAQKGDRFEYTLDLAGQTLAVAGSGVKKEKVEDGKGKEAEGGGVEITPEDKSLHLQIISKIKKELSKGGSHDSFEKFKEEKRVLADGLRAKYQKQLKPKIKLTIEPKENLENAKNADYSFHIRIAPNTSEDDHRLEFDGTKEAEIIHALGPRTPEAERRALYDQVKALVSSDKIMLKIHEYRKARKSSLFRKFFAKIIAENLKNGYSLSRITKDNKLYWKYRGLSDIKKSISIEDVFGNTINGIQTVGEAKQVNEYLQLNFLIPDRIKTAGVRGIGKTMLQEAVSHFQSNIEGIKAEWTNGRIYKKTKNKMSDNLEKYLVARLEGLSKEDAVKKTWTYYQASKLGYPKIKPGSIQENSGLREFIAHSKPLDEARKDPDTLQIFAELIPENPSLITKTQGNSI